MATDAVQRVLEESQNLTTEQLLRVIKLLLARVSADEPAVKWDDVRGTLKTPEGFDAQEWVSAMRAESEREHGIS